ncbi:hypothetical protein WA026_012621 [Henosepilachna vigintioctopunctata]|uniref:Major facilitator superfamily (MFS) profile domain-containing protein n=1 Tax=Henosepilachna vigintioctopunctata TaxID=420089 RepID=A0AAW1U6N6_9CUCU
MQINCIIAAKMKCWEYSAKLFGSYYTLFIVIVVYLIFFNGAMSLTWSSPVLVKLSKTEGNPLGHPLTEVQSDLVGSLLFIGAAIGPLLFMRSADIFGRKKTIILLSMPAIAGYCFIIFASRVEMLYIGRILIGLSIGSLSSVVSAYLSEVIFSPEKRGPYLAINSPSIQFGILVSNIVGSYFSLNTYNCMILIINISVVIIIAFCCPESPYYTIGKKGRDATLHILKDLDAEDIHKEVGLLEKDTKDQRQTLCDIFKNKSNFKPFFMATTLLLLQQFSGINILIAYSQQIFLKSKEFLSVENSSIIVSIIQVLSTLAITVTSKRFSRKSLLTVSLFGSGFFDLMLGLYFYFEDKLQEFCWIPLISLMLFVFIYDSGLDALPWVYVGEIYPQHMKYVGPALTTSFYWISLYALSIAFSRFHVSYLFFTYSLCCFSGVIFVKFQITETKDKTLREIQETLNA